MSKGSQSKRSQLQESHTRRAIANRLGTGPEHSYVKDFVYGAVDGAVTTFAVVSGVAGAQLSSGIIIVLGVANLIADGFSMAVSNFLGTKAECQLREKKRLEERAHIEIVPEGEKEEIRQIFSKKGFAGDDLERVVEVITSDEGRWVDTMVQEEHGLNLNGPKAWKAAAVTFGAFVAVGSVPLLPFLSNLTGWTETGNPFVLSVIMTALAFFIVGALKGRYVGQKSLVSGLETTLVGGGAAVLAYYIGVALRGVAGV